MGGNQYRLLLLEEFSERKRRNPSYSLNAFSKALGISAPSLSQIISGKRPLSRKAARKIIEKCLLSPEKRQLFLESAFGEVASAEDEAYRELEMETFRVIADWYHYAILSLGDLKENRADPGWISDQLRISVKEAEKALERLLKLGLLNKRGQGFFQSSKPLSMPGHSSNTALRKHQHQNLRKAEEALNDETVPLELFSSMTMAVDEGKLEEARSLIRNFRRKLCRVLESGKRERVYTLAVQLFPVSKHTGGH